MVIGQDTTSLCKSCVHKSLYWDYGIKCNEENLRHYFEYRLNSDITYVNLCKSYTEYFRYDNFWCKDLLPLEKFVSDTFRIYSITAKEGFYLNDDNEFVPQKFHFIQIGCKEDSCQLFYGGWLIIYDVNKFKATILDSVAANEFDSCLRRLENTDYIFIDPPEVLFTMKLQAYFDKDIWALVTEDGSVKTLLGDKPLIDLVYKKYLIPKINIDRYYFESEESLSSPPQ